MPIVAAEAELPPSVRPDGVTGPVSLFTVAELAVRFQVSGTTIYRLYRHR
jgi:hypothetical protein